MKIYLAGDPHDDEYGLTSLLDGSSVRRLFSYVYPLDLTRHKTLDLLVDSGAYTAYTKGKTIRVEDYSRWLKEKQFVKYISLDVIGDDLRSKTNLEYMESQGLTPIPVIHPNTADDLFRWYLEKYDYICFGGLVPYARQKTRLYEILDRLWSLIRPYWPKKIHGLGMTGKMTLSKYPWYSVDSTAFLAAQKFGRGVIPWKHEKLYRYESKTKGWQQRTADEVAYMMILEKEMTDLWKAKGVVWND